VYGCVDTGYARTCLPAGRPDRGWEGRLFAPLRVCACLSPRNLSACNPQAGEAAYRQAKERFVGPLAGQVGRYSEALS